MIHRKMNTFQLLQKFGITPNMKDNNIIIIIISVTKTITNYTIPPLLYQPVSGSLVSELLLEPLPSDQLAHTLSCFHQKASWTLLYLP